MTNIKNWFLAILLISLFGCSYNDNKAFEQAKATDTVESYNEYVNKYPNGKNASEALRLTREKLIIEAINFFNKLKIDAIECEENGSWQRALEIWEAAASILDRLGSYGNAKTVLYKNESEKRALICKTVIENPFSISIKKAIATYHGTDTYKIMRAVRVNGSITNNCPFEASNIVISLKIVKTSMASRLDIIDPNEIDKQSENSVEYITLDSIEQKIITGKTIKPGESQKFAFRSKINTEAMLNIEEPKCLIDIKTYEAK